MGHSAKSQAHGAESIWNSEGEKQYKLKAESSKFKRGAFGCWRSASLEVRGWRQKRYNFLFSSIN